VDEQLILSQALGWLLRGRALAEDFGRAQEAAGRAVEAAERYPDSWISKGIRVHAHAWFFYDAEAALEVLGGPERTAQLLEADVIERYFTKGLGSLCGQRYDDALANLAAAAKLVPDNPFVEALTAIALLEAGSPSAAEAFDRYLSRHGEHPLTELLGLDRTRKRAEPGAEPDRGGTSAFPGS
jgi:tetratricopeptide (TPR) repeat protein